MKIAGTASLKSVERMNLCDLYQQTTDALNDVIRSAKSKTLEKLYTEEYRPAIQGVNLTKIQSLETGEPVVVCFSSRCTEMNLPYPGKLYEYFINNVSGTTLSGSKSFAIMR